MNYFQNNINCNIKNINKQILAFRSDPKLIKRYLKEYEEMIDW
jgi:hypothetical protein